MTPRPPGRRQPCTAEAARARLHDAQAFLEAAETSADPDVKATNAIHAAIAAADTLCCLGLRERSGDGNHSAAVDLLRSVDPRLATLLARLLSRKQQAAYESRDLSATDAVTCVRQATILVDAARSRALRD
jgi:hypothetical protein